MKSFSSVISIHVKRDTPICAFYEEFNNFQITFTNIHRRTSPAG